MLLKINQPHRAFMNVLIAWAGEINGALEQIAGAYLAGRNSVGEMGLPNDPGWANDDSPALSRTIRWADGRNTTLLWKLPSPGP